MEDKRRTAGSRIVNVGYLHLRPALDRGTASAPHRAVTFLYCALALATAASSLAVGATSASCIAIAAAMIAASALSRVGGPVGAWRNPKPGLAPRAGGGAIESIRDFNVMSLGLVSRSAAGGCGPYAPTKGTR